MNKMQLRLAESGNTIIEVLISLLIVGTVLTAIAVTMTNSVRSTSEGRYREVATSLALEPIEYFRFERAAASWSLFYAWVPENDNDGWFCINTNTRIIAKGVFIDSTPLANCDQVLVNNTNFRRKIQIIKNATNIELLSIVSWDRGTDQSDVTVRQTLYQY